MDHARVRAIMHSLTLAVDLSIKTFYNLKAWPKLRIDNLGRVFSAKFDAKVARVYIRAHLL